MPIFCVATYNKCSTWLTRSLFLLYVLRISVAGSSVRIEHVVAYHDERLHVASCTYKHNMNIMSYAYPNKKKSLVGILHLQNEF